VNLAKEEREQMRDRAEIEAFMASLYLAVGHDKRWGTIAKSLARLHLSEVLRLTKAAMS
jgi:hypothetical protein